MNRRRRLEEQNTALRLLCKDAGVLLGAMKGDAQAQAVFGRIDRYFAQMRKQDAADSKDGGEGDSTADLFDEAVLCLSTLFHLYRGGDNPDLEARINRFFARLSALKSDDSNVSGGAT